jgi:hypothetical protein
MKPGFGTVHHYLRTIVRLGAAKRQTEYFVWQLSRSRPAEAFTPFTEYGQSAHAEWFAETYALAALNPTELARRSRAAADWFRVVRQGAPGRTAGRR